MRKLFFLSTILLSTCITTLSFAGINQTGGGGPSFILEPGESTTTDGCAPPTFYAASSDRSICMVNSTVDETAQKCSNGDVYYVITMTGVSVGKIQVYKFADNTSAGAFEVEVKDPNASGFSLVPCYQFYNTKTGDHYYTTNEEAIEILTEVYPEWGYIFENIAFYVYQKNY